MAKDPYISGVGGWLVWLIFNLLVLSPMLGIGQLYGALSDAPAQLAANSEWQQFKQAVWAVSWATVALSICAGYRLLKIHTADSVRFALYSLWAIGPGGVLLMYGLTFLIFGKTDFLMVLAQSLGPCLSAVIWTLYLKNSVRVRNTYEL